MRQMARIFAAIGMVFLLLVSAGCEFGTTEYTLTIRTNGNGSVSPSGGTYDEDTTVTLTATAASGWEFTGWSGNASGTSRTIQVTMDANKTVVANFSQTTQTQYTLTVTTSGNGSVSPAGGTYDAGTTVTLSATPASGWTFSGWSGDVSGTANTIQVTMNANKTVRATFTESSTARYTLSVSTSGNGSVSPGGGSYDAGSTVTLYATPDSGWEFAGWSGDANGSSPSVQVTMNSNKSVRATFTETSQGDTSLTYQAEATSLSNAVIETEHSGYTGSGYVNFDNETGSSLTFTVNADSAGYAELTFRFANGSTSSRPMDIEVNGSARISGHAFPATGAWTSWSETSASVYLSQGTNSIEAISSGSEGGPNMDRIIVTGDLGELETYTLTVNTNGNGSVTPSGGTYTEGTDVTLTATPASGWAFSSWSGGASGSNPSVTITMNSNVTVTANFEESEEEDLPPYANWPLTGDLGVHDPCMIKENGVYYIFGTGVGIPYKRSYDGLAWSDAGTVFRSYPSWANIYVPNHESNIWAPDIQYHNGTYYLYYSVSTFGENTSAIGLATCTSLSSGNWQDQGMVIRSTSSNNYNCIDPNMVVDQSGRVWLAFGSFWSGLKLVELNSSTMKPSSSATIHSLATRDNTAIEAPYIVYRNGYYYLFASVDYCCRGADSTYKIIVGRSSSITGPYYDKNGTRMMNGGGTIFDAGNDRWAGPGGQGLLGTSAIVHHAYDGENNGAAILMIKTLYWDANGWPYRGDSVSQADNPLFRNFRSADPSPLVHNGRYYIVCGQDQVNTNAFNMYGWRLLSSADMSSWTDHGVILRPSDVSWMPNSCAWASCIVFRNGYFYFYASNCEQIGVLRSTSITGPYEDVLGRPLIDPSTREPDSLNARDIDPMCYIDDDGQAYLFWGGDGVCRYVKLNSNMISLSGSVMDVPGLTDPNGGYRYLEAPFVIKDSGTYFMIYADQPWPSEIRYATANRISGPWTYRGVIGTPTGTGTNHSGAAFFNGQWWYTYHTEELSNGNAFSRSVCVDPMTVSNGRISRVVYSSFD